MSESAPRRHLQIVPSIEMIAEQSRIADEQERTHDTHDSLNRRVIGATARLNILGHTLSSGNITGDQLDMFIMARQEFTELSDALVESSRTMLGDTPDSGPTAS